MGYEIFISYRRNPSIAFAYLLCEKLEVMGYKGKVFMDINSLLNGEFDESLLRIMDECTNVIVVLQPNSLNVRDKDEDFFYKEIRHAIKTSKNIIPIMTNDFKWPENLPDDIANLSRYNGLSINFLYFKDEMKRLKEFLAASKSMESYNEKKHVLMYGDFDKAIQKKIIKRLGLSEEDYVIELLSEPVEILAKSLDRIYAVILMITDVTKLSSNEMINELINSELKQYVYGGGRLICTHDTIYRRTRNKELQSMMGCTVTNFQRTDIVKYNKTKECLTRECFKSLPQTFELQDGEICWGECDDDVIIFFETKTDDGTTAPLVFAREYGDGLCIYLHSGDYKDNPPGSILKPEPYFIDLLKDSLVLKADLFI